ncbi:MAG: ResB protein required for cytochrome C biosynthesis [Verrucomicrobiaceae bacterium]|nr:MAG: ResB protein required for cytochrome C biosynthesis [Verrucomicrobiaceae bacterium]
MKALSRLLDALCSLRLTLFCLAAAFVLVFAGTLAQVRFGLYLVQEEYFQSWLIWWNAPSGNLRLPVFPGGHLIGAALLLNLIASMITRNIWSWKKFGIQCIHIGIIIMLAGGLATDLFSVHSYMRIKEGGTSNYSEDSMRMELAVIDQTDPDTEQVTAIPGARLADGGTISHESLPFRMEVRGFYQNSKLQMIGQGASSVPASTQGTGQRIAVTAKPRATRMDERDSMSAVLEIIPGKGGESLGTWLVSDSLAAAQTFEADGRKWSIQLRPARYYKPYSLTLLDFTHETYPGTQIPKNFSSKVNLVDPEVKDSRQVLIYMNHPLRYQGDTYYQSGFEPDNSGTVLQVVRNPSYQAPYVACAIVSIGLIYQFIFHLAGFSRRQKTATAP